MKDLVSACPIENAMMLLSGRWPALLLYHLKKGPQRFSDLRRANPAISHRILSHHLKQLEEAGVVHRLEANGYPLRVDYKLSLSGERLMPLIDAMGEWWISRASPTDTAIPA
ncbi:DNA-binding HxlR family transcriptional regulator [Sphingomonas sp. UYAg733]